MPNRRRRGSLTRVLTALTLAGALALGGCSNATPTLREAAPSRLTVGTAISADADALGNADYRKILADNFSSVTPEIQFKWRLLHPERGTYDFTAADQVMEIAAANKQVVRATPCCGTGRCPPG